jgi:hypothetical protein
VTGTRRDNDWDRREPTRGRKLLLGVLAVAGLVVVYLIAAAIIPRWWAQRIADVVDGRLTVGALYGLFIGFVFTVAPFGVAWFGYRMRSPRRTWRGWLVWLAIVLLAASPNLMTLGIVLGGNDAAHDGDRILSVDGNGFRTWSAVGAALGIIAVIGVWYLASSRRTSRRRADEYRQELRARDQPT